MPRHTYTRRAAGGAAGRRWDDGPPRASQPRSLGRFSPPSSSAGSQAQARLQSQDFSMSSPSVSTPRSAGSPASVLGRSAGPPASVLGRLYSGHYQDNGFVSRSPSPPPPGRRGRRPRSWSGSGSGSGSGTGSGLAATPTLGQPDPSRSDEDGALGAAPAAPPAASAARPRRSGRQRKKKRRLVSQPTTLSMRDGHEGWA